MSEEVQVLSYGPADDEYHRDAMFGPVGNKLEEYDIAISPDLAKKQKLKLGDWVEVAGKPRRIADWSYFSPGKPTSGTVEIRDQGGVKTRSPLRPLTQDEIASLNIPFQSALQSVAPPNVPDVGRMGGQQLAMSQLSGPPDEPLPPMSLAIPDVGEAIRQEISGVPQRALLASEEPTDASLEYASEESDATAALDEATEALNEAQGGEKPEAVDSFINPPQPTEETKFVKREGRFAYFSDGTILDTSNKNIYFNDPAGNLHMTGPNMTRAVRVPGAKSGEKPAPPINPDLSPDDNLKQLSPEDQISVKELAAGRAPVYTRTGKESPNYSRLKAYVHLQKPDFDPSANQIRQQAKMQYFSSKSTDPGGFIQSYNQGLHHLGTLIRLSKEIPISAWKGGNTLNKIISQQFGGKAFGSYDLAANVLGTEMARAFKRNAPDQADINEWRARLDNVQTPEALKGILEETAPELLGGALITLDNGYESATGEKLPASKVLDKDSRKVLQDLGIKEFIGRDTSTGEPIDESKATPSPTPPVTPEVTRAAIERTMATDPDPNRRAKAARALAGLRALEEAQAAQGE